MMRWAPAEQLIRRRRGAAAKNMHAIFFCEGDATRHRRSFTAACGQNLRPGMRQRRAAYEGGKTDGGYEQVSHMTSPVGRDEIMLRSCAQGRKRLSRFNAAGQDKFFVLCCVGVYGVLRIRASGVAGATCYRLQR